MTPQSPQPKYILVYPQAAPLTTYMPVDYYGPYAPATQKFQPTRFQTN